MSGKRRSSIEQPPPEPTVGARRVDVLALGGCGDRPLYGRFSVVADSFYGRLHSFREWLEERGCPYAVMVPKTNAVPLGGRKKKIEQHAERLPEDAFSEVRPARDDGGRRPWEWACLDLAPDPEKGMRR